jgi:hypothetical protein
VLWPVATSLDTLEAPELDVPDDDGAEWVCVGLTENLFLLSAPRRGVRPMSLVEGLTNNTTDERNMLG